MTPTDLTLPSVHNAESKKARVTRMFNDISKHYDFLNHFLSFGIDRSWRSELVNALKHHKPKKILDMATGTGDLAIALTKINPEKIIGIDLAGNMLQLGLKKIKVKQLTDRIELREGDSENLSFPENSFDAVTVAFGVRNFENLDSGLKEAFRVLKPGGIFAILEFSHPEKFPLSFLYKVYFHYFLPFIGKIISSDRSAYTYLPESVKTFPYGFALTSLLENIGFLEVTYKPLTFGICCLYTGKK